MSRAEAVKAAEAEGGGGGGGTAVRYSQLVAEGLEEDTELVDKATDVDRDWDTVVLPCDPPCQQRCRPCSTG